MKNLHNYSCRPDKLRFVDFVHMLVVHKGLRETDEQKIIFASLDEDHDGVLNKGEVIAAMNGDR